MDGDKKNDDLNLDENDAIADEFYDDGSFEDTGSDDDLLHSDLPDDLDQEDLYSDDSGSISDDEWDSYDEDFTGEDDGETAPPTTKKPVSKKMVLGAAVMIALGIIGYQFISSGKDPVIVPSTQAPPQPTPTTNEAIVSGGNVAPSQSAENIGVTPSFGVGQLYKDDMEKAAPANDNSSKGGLLNNLDDLAQIERFGTDGVRHVFEDDMPYDSSTADTIDSVPPHESPSALTPLPQDDFVDRAVATPHTPATDRINQTGNAQIQTNIAQADMAAPAIPATTTLPAPDHAALDTITAQLESIASRLGALEQNLESLSDIKTTTNALEKRLNTIEDTLARQAAAPPVTRQPAPSQTAPKQPTPNQPEARTAPAAPAPAPTRRTTATPQPQAETSRIQWILKSAQPGHAMVSRQGSSDVISVSTGQSLPGIGTISSITIENGRWVIKGTQGIITQ